MTTSLKISMALTLCFSTYAVTAEAAPRAPRIQTGPDAEISFDGLHRVDRSVMDMAWAKPTLDLTLYSKLLLVSGGFAYREVEEPSRYDRSATEFPISEENRVRLRETVGEIWTEEFQDLENWEIVNQPGRDVLILGGARIDNVSAVPPPNRNIGRGDVYLSQVGQATLVLELRDSMSGEILARSVDRRAAESTWAVEASTVTTWAEVRRLARTWARILVNRLDQIAEL